MRWLWQISVGAALIGFAVGCGRDESPASGNVSPPATLKSAAPVRDVVPPSTADGAAESGPSSDPSPVAAVLPPEVQTVDDAESDRNDLPERIALLTPGGPLLIDVLLTIDGRPYKDVFESHIDELLEAGDTDGNERSTWKEFVSNRTYLEAEMSDAPAADSRQMKTLVERYDENRDGLMQRSEAATWLGREAGVSARPFAVRSSRSYRPAPHVTSQIWQRMDADNNGRLSDEEIRRMPETLWSLDSDDDRTISHSDLLSLREQLEASGVQRTMASYAASHYAAIHLEPQFDAHRLDYLLNDLYAARQMLEPASFAQFADLFEQLDADGDGILIQDELAGLATIDPHIHLSIAFDGTAKPASAKIEEARELTPAIDHLLQPAPDRIVVSLGSTRIVISALAVGSMQGADWQGGRAAELAQIRLMAHDQCDALFESLDENSDGILGEREIATSAIRLEEWDANNDEQLTSSELPSCMIVAFIWGERLAEQSFYVPQFVASVGEGVDAAAWFQHADLNGDGDVSRREFLGASEQFSRLDANADGFIDPGEAAAFR